MGLLEDAQNSHLTFAEQASAPATPAAGLWEVYFKSDGIYIKDDAGTEIGPLGAGGGGGISAGSLIGLKAYNPATLATYTTTSSTYGDVDAANLAVTFTAPASGNVLVRLTVGLVKASDTSSVVVWALRSGTTTVPGTPTQVVNASNAGGMRATSAAMYVTGLTPGTSYTYKWAWRRQTGTGTLTMFAGGATDETGSAVMEVIAAP